jgi:2,4-dienoyl-CoA reductase-like NADH-dependent reductase (Old Yellow Enzyme family)
MAPLLHSVPFKELFEETAINALCRPLICEPDLVKRWSSGDHTASACLSDNRCFRPAIAGEGLRCLLWD